MIRGDAPWRAGKSAYAWSQKTRKEGRPTALYLIFWASVLGYGGYHFQAKNLLFVDWLIFGGIALGFWLILGLLNRKERKEARNKASRTVIGAKAEKRSAWLWMWRFMLSPNPYYVMHDRSIPKKYNRGKYTAANIDHIIISRWGAANPDTKVRGQNSTHWDSDASEFEFSCLEKAIRKFEADQRIEVPSLPLWAIWGKLQGTNGGGVLAMHSKDFPRWLKKKKRNLSKTQTKALYKYLDKEFPRYAK